jgi:hypothetical protein
MFVGRREEIASVRRALEAGRNVVLIGRYGIGRTSLVRQAAVQMGAGRPFVFVDFASTPAAMSRSIHEELFQSRGRGRRAVPRSFRTIRSLLIRDAPATSRPPVLVLDGIARLTAPKLELMRALTETGRFGFVAVAEAFLPPRDLLRVRTALFPNVLLRLGPLRRRESEEFFAEASERFGLGWKPQHTRLLASTRHGYPLAMAETVARALRGARRKP